MGCKRGAFHLNPKTVHQLSIFRGLFFALISGAFYSMTAVIVKQMKNLHPGQVALYRFIGVFVLTMPETAHTGQNPLGPRKLRLLLVVRGICGGLNIFFNFVAFRYLNLGEASVIMFSSPVVVTIFARVFLKEPCNILQSIAVVITVVGITFTTKLPSRFSESTVAYSKEELYGILAAIFSLFSISALQLLTRKVRIVHQSIINFTYSWAGIIVIGISTAISGTYRWQQCGNQSVYIFMIAFFSFCGQKLIVLALQCEYAGPVTTARAAADIGLAFLWQIFIFHDIPDSYGIIGAILVAISIVLIAVGKWLTSLNANLFPCEQCKCISTC